MDFGPPMATRSRPAPKPVFNVDFSKFFVQAKEEVGQQHSKKGGGDDEAVIEIFRVEGIKNLTAVEQQ